jgi:hypothetical protein
MASPALTLKEKFEQLLEATTAFFTDQQGNIPKDREVIERLRQLALALATECEKPHTFERFLAYLLGTHTIEALYPLHAIQFMCLVLHTLRKTDLKITQRDEIATAAFFADIGCRGAWLSYQNAHAGAGVFHLRDLGASWWSAWIERMILFHHDPKMDPSPNHIFSVVAHFLALTRGTGVDDAAQDIYTPAQAIEKVVENNTLDAEGRKLFLNAFSVYPLGSWVRLSSGDTGIVIANHAGNPLRPVVGIYNEGQSYGMLRTDSSCNEIDLKKHVTTFIAGDTQPTDQQKNLFLSPHLWIHNWNRATSEDETVAEESIEEPLETKTEVPPALPVDRSHIQVKGITLEPSTPTAEAIAGITNFVAAPPPVPAPPIEQAAPAPTVLTPANPPPPPKKPEVVDPAELPRLGSQLLVDMAQMLEKLEVPLHQISHRYQSESAPLPKEFKKFRQAIQEIRAFCHTLASLGDTEIGLVTGVLSLWEGELAASEQQIQDTRAYMSVFLQPWEQRKKDVQALIKELRETAPAPRWVEIRSDWQNSIKPGMEMLATLLMRGWDQKHQILATTRTSIHDKIETGQRTKELLLEKLSMMHFARGLKLRKEKAWDEAIDAFQKALALDPRLWEAHTYIGLCHLDASEQTNFKRRKFG